MLNNANLFCFSRENRPHPFFEDSLAISLPALAHLARQIASADWLYCRHANRLSRGGTLVDRLSQLWLFNDLICTLFHSKNIISY